MRAANSQTTEIIGPLEEFESFSLYIQQEKFGFSVVHNSTFSKMLEIQLTLIRLD